MFRRKKSEVVEAKYEVHLSRNKLDNKRYSELVRSQIPKDPSHLSFFDNLISKMNGFPINWLEYADSRIFSADGDSSKRTKYLAPRENIEQRIFLINPRYLEALPQLYTVSDRQGIDGFDALMRYPIIDITNPTEVVYEMDLMKLHLAHPKIAKDGKYISIFSQYAMEYNAPKKIPGRIA